MGVYENIFKNMFNGAGNTNKFTYRMVVRNYLYQLSF